MKKMFLAAIMIYGIRYMVFSEGFYIDGGISMNMATYGQSINSFIDNYVDHYSLNRIVFGGSITSGYRIIPGLYIVGTGLLTRDIISGFGYDINLYSPSLFAGMRWYPMKSKKYLQLGMEAGPSWLILESDIPHVSNETGLGLGINAIVAMDFNPVSNGPHFQLCGDMMYAHINGGSEITAGIFLKVAYKKAKKILDSDDDIDTLSLAAGIVLPVLTAIGTWIGYNMIPSSDRS